MPVKIFQVDAFTDTPFSGNPAAVCLLAGERSAKWMQDVAAEMNLSETAFLWPLTEGYSLRWFTPATEVDLCGHATLASAHTLWESGTLDKSQPAIFFTRSGKLTAVLEDDGIEMDFPASEAETAAGYTVTWSLKNKWQLLPNLLCGPFSRMVFLRQVWCCLRLALTRTNFLQVLKNM